VILGEGYAGVLERDGWAPYRRFEHATHQSCLAQLLRRCRELVSDAVAGQAKTPHAVRRILEHALALRWDRDAGALDTGQLAAEVRALEAAVDRLVAGATRYPPNRRLLDHLARERDHLFTFLGAPGVQATNWRAEQAIRPAVVCRKAWGGNRTWARRRHLAGPHQCAANRQPARPRPHRAARSPATSTSADPGRPRHPWALTSTPAISIRCNEPEPVSSRRNPSAD